MRFLLAINRKINGQNDGAVRAFEEVLTRRGHAFARFNHDERMFDNADILVCFGGDGTTLYFSKLSEGKLPVLAVNLGTLGFLAQIEPKGAERAVEQLEKDAYKLIKHSLIHATDESSGLKFCALNEVILCSSSRSETVRAEVCVKGIKCFELCGDGVLTATPTGSTAYMQSLNGPAILPECPVFCVMPIAGNGMPLVFPDTQPLRLKTVEGSFSVYADGKLIAENFKGSLKLQKNSFTVPFIEFENTFTKKIIEKYRSSPK